MSTALERTEHDELMQEIRKEIEKLLLSQKLSEEEKLSILSTALKTVEDMER